jgi:asparagine synthase (glutamine-hydrolysing)
MCGIAGEFVFDETGHVDETRIEGLAAVLHHRGPDDWGYYVGRGRSALLLNTRLSIVDIAGGRQPIANEDGSIWVVLNGELYGFARQRADLEGRGHRFRTRTDTEVLVHLYEEYGESFVDHLRGEYAFALLDERRGVLYLVRDRFGIKPLCYAETPGGVVFGSEAKAVFQYPQVPRRLNQRRVLSTLYGLLTPGETYFDGVHDVEPGCLIRLDRGGLAKRRYWDLPFVPEDSAQMGDREALDECRRLLREAVAIRLHGDVEVGLYLSGGTDSTSIAALAAELADHSLPAFTIAFANRDYGEGDVAARSAARLGVQHHVVDIGRGGLAPHFERSIWHGEIAVANSHGIAKLLLSEAAARHVKVVLTGEGADEALAGYNVFPHLQLLEAVRRDPADATLRRAVAGFVRTVGPSGGVQKVVRFRQYERISQLFGCYPYAMVRALDLEPWVGRLVSPPFRTATSGADPIADIASRIGVGRMAGLGAVSGHQYYAFKTNLPQYILACLGDRAEMANSIEGRVPFLDHELVEFACRLPARLKVRDGSGKWVLRQAMRDHLPAMHDSMKRPFMAPSAETLGLDRGDGHLAPFLDRATTSRIGIFDPFAIATLRAGLRVLPGRSPVYGLAEALLTVVASVHALHDLFCRRFDDAVTRFSSAAAPRTRTGHLVAPPGTEALTHAPRR